MCSGTVRTSGYGRARRPSLRTAGRTIHHAASEVSLKPLVKARLVTRLTRRNFSAFARADETRERPRNFKPLQQACQADSVRQLPPFPFPGESLQTDVDVRIYVDPSTGSWQFH